MVRPLKTRLTTKKRVSSQAWRNAQHLGALVTLPVPTKGRSQDATPSPRDHTHTNNKSKSFLRTISGREVYMCVHVCAFVWAYVGQGVDDGCLFNFSILFLRWRSLMTQLKISYRLAGKPAPKIRLSLPLGLQVNATVASLLKRELGSNSDLPACTAALYSLSLFPA